MNFEEFERRMAERGLTPEQAIAKAIKYKLAQEESARKSRKGSK